MEIGNLNQRITILEHRTVVDEIGNHTTKWEEIFSLWAKVTVKTATETTDAGITKEVQKLEFLVRQSPASLNINSTNFSHSFPKQHLQHHRTDSALRPQQLSEN